MYELVRLDYGVGVRLPSGAVMRVGHIIGIGRNYKAHAAEQGASVPERPMVFTKNPSSACLSGNPIVIPPICRDPQQVDFEGELAVILGRAARDVSAAEALSCVLGYCPANDVSARWWQKKGSGGQFCRGKSFDTFCPMGPGVTPAASVADPQALTIETRVNGEVMQRDSTGQMIFPVAELIADLSRGTTLAPGTAILTGTPSGVGMARMPPVYLKPGDGVEISIRGEGVDLGVLKNSVSAG